MKDITQLFNYHIGLEVHIGSPGQHLGKGMIDEVRNPMFATGIGLVLKGFDLAVKHGMGIGNTAINKEETVKPTMDPFFSETAAATETPIPTTPEPNKKAGFLGNWKPTIFDDIKVWLNDGEDFTGN